jgi:hypothetical protein
VYSRFWWFLVALHRFFRLCIDAHQPPDIFTFRNLRDVLHLWIFPARSFWSMFHSIFRKGSESLSSMRRLRFFVNRGLRGRGSVLDFR